MNRCLNNVFGYCRGACKPIPFCAERTEYTWQGTPVFIPIDAARCELNELDCGQFLTFTEVLVLTGTVPEVPSPAEIPR
ncbi:hypothetical protein ES703_100768 [subsurface metagenome]